MAKKNILILLTMLFISIPFCASAKYGKQYEWAEKGIDYCVKNKIIEGDDKGNLMLDGNLTRAQMAKILVVSFGLEEKEETSFADMEEEHWEYKYVCAIEDYMPITWPDFTGSEYVTRQEFAATLVSASGLTKGNVRNSRIIDANFSDADEVYEKYKPYICMAVERAYLKGSDGKILPQGLLTRAEVCTFMQRVLEEKDNLTWEDLGVISSNTPLIGDAQISFEAAQEWAKDRGASDKFIEAAPIYWEYGELTGLRPEILYAQAAKETGYGKFGGAVIPEMNNWAGIKIKNPIGDRPEDHESFETPDDGVRAHFNHMGAYVGLAPIGEAHDRYYVVKSISWAGSVKNLEALGGRWCPDLYYGYSILHDVLEPLMSYGE